MKLTHSFSEDSLVGLTCEGEITLERSDSGFDNLEQVAGPNVYSQRVLIDLSQAPFINSSGIGWLIRCHKRFRTAGGRMVLHSIPLLVRQIFTVLRMDQVFDIAANEQQARQLAMETSA